MPRQAGDGRLISKPSDGLLVSLRAKIPYDSMDFIPFHSFF